MYQYEQLVSIAEHEHEVIVVEKSFKSNALGLCNGNRIGISKSISTSKEKACVLAEEMGHYITSYGDITDQRSIKNQKQELRAREWAHQKLLLVDDFIAAYQYGCRSHYEVAEYLNVTLEFLTDALETFCRKYGVCKVFDNHIVYFDPLGVMEVFDNGSDIV